MYVCNVLECCVCNSFFRSTLPFVKSVQS
uniref:Uncharacterized protein n=1 Tax=Anguilla anguilla TaxID=7936 RepID=A0A0E9V1N6_ANGAN